jgi:CRISPR-associated protein Cmr5
MPESIEQIRARFAFKKVTLVKQNGDQDKEKKYRSYVKKMPAYIKNNGLAQALAFANSKSGSEEAWGDLYNHIKEWLLHDEEPTKIIRSSTAYQQNGNNNDLCNLVINLNTMQYRLATTQVMGLLNWLKRFADGMLKEEE